MTEERPDPPGEVLAQYARKSNEPGLRPVLDSGDEGDVKNAYLDLVHRRLLARHLHLLGPRCADLGCGIGRLTGMLGRDATVVGLDYSPDLLAIARTTLGRDALLARADLARLPLASGSLSGALMGFVSLHFDDSTIERAFAEVARVLQPGGHFLLFEHVAPAPEPRMYRGVVNRPVPVLRDLLGAAGLELDACFGGKKTPSRVVDWVKQGRLPRFLWGLGAALDGRLCSWRLEHTDYVECLLVARKPGGTQAEYPSSREMFTSMFLPRRRPPPKR